MTTGGGGGESVIGADQRRPLVQSRPPYALTPSLHHCSADVSTDEGLCACATTLKRIAETAGITVKTVGTTMYFMHLECGGYVGSGARLGGGGGGGG